MLFLFVSNLSRIDSPKVYPLWVVSPTQKAVTHGWTHDTPAPFAPRPGLTSLKVREAKAYKISGPRNWAFARDFLTGASARSRPNLKFRFSCVWDVGEAGHDVLPLRDPAVSAGQLPAPPPGSGSGQAFVRGDSVAEFHSFVSMKKVLFSSISPFSNIPILAFRPTHSSFVPKRLDWGGWKFPRIVPTINEPAQEILKAILVTGEKKEGMRWEKRLGRRIYRCLDAFQVRDVNSAFARKYAGRAPRWFSRSGPLRHKHRRRLLASESSVPRDIMASIKVDKTNGMYEHN